MRRQRANNHTSSKLTKQRRDEDKTKRRGVEKERFTRLWPPPNVKSHHLHPLHTPFHLNTYLRVCLYLPLSRTRAISLPHNTTQAHTQSFTPSHSITHTYHTITQYHYHRHNHTLPHTTHTVTYTQTLTHTQLSFAVRLRLR